MPGLVLVLVLVPVPWLWLKEVKEVDVGWDKILWTKSAVEKCLTHRHTICTQTPTQTCTTRAFVDIHMRGSNCCCSALKYPHTL